MSFPNVSNELDARHATKSKIDTEVRQTKDPVPVINIESSEFRRRFAEGGSQNENPDNVLNQDFLLKNAGQSMDREGFQSTSSSRDIEYLPGSTSMNDFVGEKKESLFGYLWSELSRGYVPDENEAAYDMKRQRVYAFVLIPGECEKFMFYAFMLCVDSFLFIFTFLPLRLMIVLMRLLLQPWLLFRSQGCLSSSQKCDIIKGIIIAVGCILMHHVDASMVYHMIRGQAIIKLYIFFNLLDIGDKLLSSFGQDVLDSLMWTVADSKRQKTLVVLFHLLCAVIYVFLHSMLVLLQAVSLNVAFNSHNKALLTILISNNAVELKGSVFKKFEKTNLFQMACSDARERFHLVILILIVLFRNMADFNWDVAHLADLLPDMVMLLLSEVIVDGTKHAFITKFNNISATVYKEYTVLMARDVITSRKKKAFSDVSDQVSRRLGLIPLPLACLLLKVLYQSVKIQSTVAVINVILGCIVLLGAKIISGVIIYGMAIDYWSNHLKQQPKSARKRHKSGIDQDLLNCENNYHYKPTGSKQPAPSGGKPVAQEPDTLSTATTDLLQPSK